MDVGYVAAIAGGLLALFSPCAALLLPSFFAYAFQNSAQLLARTALFYAGLCVTLVPLGAGSAAVSTLFYGHRDTLILVAGWLIIALGVLQLLGLGFAWAVPARLQNRFTGRAGAAPIFGLGAVYGFAGFCSGPILGAVLTVAATGGVVRGGLLLACYALGMALPLFLLALVWNRFDLGQRRWLRGRGFTLGPLRLHTNSIVSGLLFIGIGVVFLVYDGTASLTGFPGSAWLEEVAYQVQGPLLRIGSSVDLLVLGLVAMGLLGAGLYQAHRVRTRRQEERDDVSSV